MSDFEKITTIETIIPLMISEEETRQFLIRYEVIKIDHAAEYRAECEAAGETCEEIDEDDELNEPDFFPIATITIRELSEFDMCNLSDEPEDNKELGKEVCRLSGWLIMSSLMQDYGYDPHILCDDFSADLEYVWSALNDETMSAASLLSDILKNIFYVDTISIAPEYDNADFKANYLEGLLGHLIMIINDTLDDEVEPQVVHKRCAYDEEDDHYIDLICFFPAPLPFDNSKQQQMTDLACGLVSRIRNEKFERMRNPDVAQEKPEVEIHVAPELYLRSAGMRVSGVEPYPESAKNKAEWDLLENAGWYECGNTRLLYMTRFDCETEDDE